MDDKNNKIDQHFKKQLDKLGNGNSRWSAEDDLFWDNMQGKVDLIYRQKRKRRLMAFLFSLAFLISAIGGISYFNYTPKAETSSSLSSKNPINHSQENQSNSSSLDNKEIQKNSIAEIPQKPTVNNSAAESTKKTSQQTNTKAPNSNNQKTSNSIAHSLNKKPTYSLQLNNQESSLFNLKDQGQKPFNHTKNNYAKQFINLDTSRLETNDTLKNPIDLRGVSIGKLNYVSESRLAPLKIQLLNDQQFLLKSSFSSRKSYDMPVISRPRDIWELGFSHSRFIKNPFLHIPPSQIKPDQSVSISDKRFRSFNLIANLNLSKKISLTSGIHYLSQYIQVDYKFYQQAYEENENALQNSLSNIVGRESISLENQIKESDLFIKFLEGKTAQEGDLLDIFGQADAYARIYQIPLQLNYKFRYSNWELVAFTGVSVNAIFLKIPRFDVEVYKENELISDDINFRPLRKELLVPNFILGAGVRYTLWDFTHLHLYYNSNPLDRKFARIQMGVTYSL